MGWANFIPSNSNPEKCKQKTSEQKKCLCTCTLRVILSPKSVAHPLQQCGLIVASSFSSFLAQEQLFRAEWDVPREEKEVA